MSKTLYRERLTGKICNVIDKKVAGIGNRLNGMTLWLYKTGDDDVLKVMCYQEFNDKFVEIGSMDDILTSHMVPPHLFGSKEKDNRTI